MGERVNGTGLARAAGGPVGIATGIGARGSRVGLSAVPIVGKTVVGRSGAEEGGAMGSGGSGVGEGLAATGSGDGRGRVRTGGSVSVMAVGDGVGLLPAVGGVVGAFVCGGCGEVVGRCTGAEVSRTAGAAVGAATGGGVSGTIGAVVAADEVVEIVGARVSTPSVGCKAGAATGAGVTPPPATSISTPRQDDDQTAGHSRPLVLAATHWPYATKASLAMQLSLGRES